jgi:teichuronic acid exporter
MKNKVIKSAIWSLIDTFGGFLIKFIFAIWITRLLTPYDYGLIAYMTIFLSIGTWISEGGFGTALIQMKKPTDIDFSTSYFFNVAISLLFFFIYLFIAPFVAIFFNEPELKLIMQIISINLLLNSLHYIHLIKLIKALRFREQSIINLLSAFISGFLGLIIAYRGFGYWALVIQLISNSLLRLIGYWIVAKWAPVMVFSIHSFKEQFYFGYKVFIKGILDSIFKESITIIIGKMYQTSALGNFSRGQKFYDLFIVQTGIAFNKVLYPSMAEIVDKPERQKDVYIKTYNLLFFLMAPISLFLFLLSEPIVVVLLTEKWILAAEYFKLFSIVGFIYLLLYYNSTTILSSNNPTIYLNVDLIQKVLIVVSVLLTYDKGINNIIIGWVVVNYIFYFIYEFLMLRVYFFEKVKYKKIFEVLICLVPQLVVYHVTILIFHENIWILVMNSMIQPLTYILTFRVLKLSMYDDFRKVIRPLLPLKIKWLF